MDYKNLVAKLDEEQFELIEGLELTQLSEKLLVDVLSLNELLQLETFELENDLYIQDIFFIPFIFFKCHKSALQEDGSEPDFSSFLRLTRRLYEFLIQIWMLDNICLQKQYLEFDKAKYNDYIDYYIQNIKQLANFGFKIDSNSAKNEKNTINFIDSVCQEEIAYESTKVIPAFSKKVDMEVFFLINDTNKRIYYNQYQTRGDNAGNGKGGWWKREKYDTSDVDVDFVKSSKKRNFATSIEEKVEKEAKGTFIGSPMTDNKSKKGLGFKPKTENSTYKRFKISRAISNNIGRMNQKLMSDYKIPDMDLMSIFIREKIINQSDFLSNLALASFLTGFTYEQIIEALMGFDSGLKFNLEKGVLSWDLANIFAKNVAEEYTNSSMTKHAVRAPLPQTIVALLLELDLQLAEHINRSEWMRRIASEISREVFDSSHLSFKLSKLSAAVFSIEYVIYLKRMNPDLKESEITKNLQHNDSLKPFIEEIKTLLHHRLITNAKSFDKTIKITPSRLAEAHFRYRLILHDESDIAMLFFKRLSKSDEVKVCYTSMPTYYHLHRNWFEELQQAMGIDEMLKNRFDIKERFEVDEATGKYIGSPYVVTPGKSKNFFNQLENLYKLTNDSLIADTLLMIYIRYALSIVLATRDFGDSCNLQNYSKRFRLLSLQEKNKDDATSKRIIPLCLLAQKLITKFYELKEIYGFDEFVPVLLLQGVNNIETKVITQGSIAKWANQLKVNIDLDFINKIPLRFGRHIVTSRAVHANLKGEYLDALMNHFQMGTEDQGRYSNLSNPDYFYSVRSFLETLSKEYLPSYSAAYSNV